jgi:hypothetical protein
MTSSINKIKFNFLKTIVMVNDVLKCSLEEETERARYMLRLQREWMKVKDRTLMTCSKGSTQLLVIIT